MECLNNNIFVRYDLSHNKVFKIGDLELIRPDAWEVKDDSAEDMTKTESNVNKLHVHPQIATIVKENGKFPYKKGDKVFLHYMAYEWAEQFEIDGEDCTMIDGEYVLFVIKDGEFIMPEGFYLGEEIFTEGAKTESGIYLTPFDKVKKAMMITITHKPEGDNFVEIGETVLSCDDKQYILNINDKDYVWLKKSEIVAKIEDAA